MAWETSWHAICWCPIEYWGWGTIARKIERMESARFVPTVTDEYAYHRQLRSMCVVQVISALTDLGEVGSGESRALTDLDEF